MPELQDILTIVRKDLLQERRSKAVLVATLFFSGVVLFILALALGPEPAILQRAAPGVMWVALAFASVISAAQSYQQELESGAWEQLLLYPLPRTSLYLGKLLAHWLYLALLALAIAGLSALLFAAPLHHPLVMLVVLALGSLGLALIATFYAALTANLRAREALLPLLMFPLIIPILLASIRASSELMRLGDVGITGEWLRLLAGVDLIYLLVCSTIFRFVVDD